MFLSDVDIQREIERGGIRIEPFEIRNIQPASVDLTLGEDFKFLEDKACEGVIRFDKEPRYIEQRGEIILPSNQFVLGTTLEYVGLSERIAAQVQGRSSIGRRGLFIQNAGWVDPGFEGNLTLELYNPNALPIRLTPGTRICQLIFAYTKTPARHPYAGKYKGQRGTTGSRSFIDREYRRKE
jgi:dCTP deaminase